MILLTVFISVLIVAKCIVNVVIEAVQYTGNKY